MNRTKLLLVTMLLAACGQLPTTPTGPAAPTVTPLPSSTPAPTSTPAPVATVTPQPTPDLSWVLDAPAGGSYRLPLTVRHLTPDRALFTYALAEPQLAELVVWQQHDRTDVQRLTLDAGESLAQVGGLLPSTSYQAQLLLQVDGQVSRPLALDTVWPTLSFETPTGEAQGLRIAVFGDSGFAQPVTRQLAELISQLEVDMVLHTGDVVYRIDENPDPPAAYLLKYYQMLEPILRRMPLYPVAGNHEFDGPTYWDGAPYYYQAFPPLDDPDLRFPADGDGSWYAFSYGDLQFVMTNTQVLFGYPGRVEQEAWLAERVRDDGYRATIVVGHVPPFSNGRHQTDSAIVRSQWGHLLTEPRVVLTLGGHDHNYQHFEVEGKTFVVAGAGSATLYQLVGGDTPLRAGASATSFVLLEVGADNLLVSAIDLSSGVLDSFEVPLP